MRTLTIQGTEYKLADKPNDDKLLVWAKNELGDPLDTLTQDLIKHPNRPPQIIELATKQAFFQLRTQHLLTHNSDEIKAIVWSEKGIRYQLYLVFAEGNPNLTPDEVWQLHEAACKEHGDNYLDPDKKG